VALVSSRSIISGLDGTDLLLSHFPSFLFPPFAVVLSPNPPHRFKKKFKEKTILQISGKGLAPPSFASDLFTFSSLCAR
jgi:hypothetical protein